MAAATSDTSDLTLYHMEYCPFCQRVRSAMARLGITMAMKDTVLDPAARRDLIAGGGMSQVPCLRIQKPDGSVEWIYESADIVEYLRLRYGTGQGNRI